MTTWAVMRRKIVAAFGINGTMGAKTSRSVHAENYIRSEDATQRSYMYLETEAMEADFLDEDLVKEVVNTIYKDWRTVGLSLNLSTEEIQGIEAKCPQEKERTVEMLRAWQRKGTGYDTISRLAEACRSCHFDELANELEQGLVDDIMLSIAIKIGHNWKVLAKTLRLDTKDIEQLEDFSEDKQPYQMLMLWRRRQDRSVDVLGALAKGLRESGLPDLAYDLVQGVTDEILCKLAMLIGGSWEKIALHLGFTEEELEELKSDKFFETATILNMLTKWRERHDYTRDRFGFLMEALRACDLSNLAELMEEERHRMEQSKKVALSAKTEEYPEYAKDKDFGGFASPLVEGFIDPPPRLRPEFVGMQKGIQGYRNSCYLDCTLFSMFAYNGVFDLLLRRTQGQGDLQEYEKVQKTLRESIVNPLRMNGFVRADRIFQLREHLDQLGTTKGLMSEEKDPEEFLHTLLSEVFKSQPLLKIRHGANKAVDESNIHQIFLKKDESLTLPTVEQLLLQSFQEHDLKLVEAPSCLIVQMPRFGTDYKMYNRILPSLQLDVTNIIEDYPRQCTVCGNLAVFQCSECKTEEALEYTTLIKNYCEDCFQTMHGGTHRKHHKPTTLTVPDHFLTEFFSKTMEKGFSELVVNEHHQRLLTPKLMDLFAVICIKSSHYVAFVKAGREKDSEWVFFDSMADMQGDKHGYNIPQITHLKDFLKWVDMDHIKARIEGKQLTEIVERLLGDAYICMYSEKLRTGAALHSVGISVEDFGGFASPLVKGFIDPPPRLRPEFVGMEKGIQGYQNSCYLDSTLFSMFAYNGVFDPLLRRTQGLGDLQEYEKVQKTLRESIVNPLRKNGFVRADRILQLREHLDQLGTTKSLMSEKKDPEEFLNTLLSEVFKSQPLLKIRHGANKAVAESNIHQIFLEKDESLTLPTVEQLLLQSFQEHDLKLVEAPSCLIVQMPRFGTEYKMYNWILPSLQLDVTNIIEECK
ncbi:uncharacterized protein LOC119736553 [Patiria miniata]|uniref:Uncharacterized protein n=1 Tax=Patiria miniata TaxID=46514 RepID=A0A914AR10_PATMI|nr:uncharacterized protein LOC119736553 [Patiria miniata]